VNPESPWLYKTCMYSAYFTERMTAIIQEINSLYEVDGFFTNGWPSTGEPPECHCEACKKLADRATPEGHEQHLARVLYIWKLWDSTAKQKKWESVYVGNLGGGIRAVTDLNQVASVAGWFNADHQGRSGTTPIWDFTQQGRVACSVMKGRTITNVTGSYANTSPLWRHTSKAPLEATMWMAQTVASGMTPWYHWLGGKPEDHRWEKTGRDFFQWLAANEPHFVNEHSIATLGVVFAQRTNAFYQPPGGRDVTEFQQGMYKALLDGRFLFDFVHEDDLGPETLAKYEALILPNVALLSSAQCAQLGDYAGRGGSLLATFETGFYDERSASRSEWPLADVFGARVAAKRVGPNGNAAYARMERDHPILQGFENTKVLPLAEYYIPLGPAPDAILTVLPPFPTYPPEMVYPRIEQTSQPAVVLRQQGTSRRVYLPGDTDRAYWRSQNPDLSRLLVNCIRWMTKEAAAVSVTGAGMVETFAWKTRVGFAVHLLNYNNPEMLRGWFTNVFPIGPQKVRMRLPSVEISKVKLLRAGKEVTFSRNAEMVDFTIPGVTDYEVAALV
jgi:Beta-galactosidase trimerisation domain